LNSDDNSLITKSSDDSNTFAIDVKTLDNNSKHKQYTFSLNEMEVTFKPNSDNVASIVLRDTSVNKKIELSESKSILVNVKGQDVVGKFSENNGDTSRESILNLIINQTVIPNLLELDEVYTLITTEDDEEDEDDNDGSDEGNHWWDSLLK
jgi:hypothetical protein